MKKRGRGRPKKEIVKKARGFRFEPALLEAFETKARNNGLGLTALLEMAMKRELRSNLVGGKRSLIR